MTEQKQKADEGRKNGGAHKHIQSVKKDDRYAYNINESSSLKTYNFCKKSLAVEKMLKIFSKMKKK